METQKQSGLDLKRRLRRAKKLAEKANSMKEKDECPVCEYDLYHSPRRSQRVGLINKTDKIFGWLCPNCNTEFDLKNNIIELFGDDVMKGEA